MHVHADPNKNKSTAAKFFVKSDGTTVVDRKGRLSDIQIRKIRKYIKK